MKVEFRVSKPEDKNNNGFVFSTTVTKNAAIVIQQPEAQAAKRGSSTNPSPANKAAAS